MLNDFQNIFTLGLSSDCVMNWSLRIPSHLKRVATLPCEILMFKIWSKSMFVYHKLINWIIVSSGIWSSLVIYAAISLLFLIYYASHYLFRELCLPWHSVHHSLLPVQKCNNVTDLYELPDFCSLNSQDLSTFISKYGAASLPEKAQDVDDLRQNLIDAWFGVE